MSFYRFRHQERIPTYWGSLIPGVIFALAFLCMFLLFVLFLRDIRLLGWGILVPVIGGMFLFGYLFNQVRKGLSDVRCHRQNISDCFIAFTDRAFVHQTYDDQQGSIVRREIPLANLIGFYHEVVPIDFPLEIHFSTEKVPWYKRALMALKEAYFVSDAVPTSAPTHVILVHYLDASGKEAILKLDYFAYDAPAPLDETLNEEWAQVRREQGERL